MKLLVHVEQYDVVGILPSQLESLGLLVKSMGISQAAFIDGTIDGVRRSFGFERYENLESFMTAEQGPMIAFSPKGRDIRTFELTGDAWLIFGPAMGRLEGTFDHRVMIPGGELNSRDAVPIALWEASKWRAQ